MIWKRRGIEQNGAAQVRILSASAASATATVILKRA